MGVKKATFEVYSGEIFVIMGLSGSGKSTLVRMLNQLIKPTAGHIYIDGEDIATMGKEELRRVRRTKNEYGISEICSISASYSYTKMLHMV